MRRLECQSTEGYASSTDVQPYNLQCFAFNVQPEQLANVVFEVGIIFLLVVGPALAAVATKLVPSHLGIRQLTI